MEGTETTAAVETPSAGPAPEAPSWANDALDVLIGDDYADVEATAPEGGPADTALEPDGDKTETPESGDATADAEPDDPRIADLPDNLKEILKTVPRSARGAFIDHFEGKATTRVNEAKAIEERNQKDADARELKLQEIRSNRGQYIGEVEGTRDDGTPVPTFKELDRLLTTKGGEYELAEKYDLSRDDALDLRTELTTRRAMLDGSLDDFRNEAWEESGNLLGISLATSGLPVDQIWKDVQSISDVVPSVVAHLNAKHAAALAEVKQDYEGRLKAATANAPAVAARAAARTMPTPETGGRGDTGGARVYRQSELADVDFVRANEADIDRAYEEGRIVPG